MVLKICQAGEVWAGERNPILDLQATSSAYTAVGYGAHAGCTSSRATKCFVERMEGRSSVIRGA